MSLCIRLIIFTYELSNDSIILETTYVRTVNCQKKMTILLTVTLLQADIDL